MWAYVVNAACYWWRASSDVTQTHTPTIHRMLYNMHQQEIWSTDHDIYFAVQSFFQKKTILYAVWNFKVYSCSVCRQFHFIVSGIYSFLRAWSECLINFRKSFGFDETMTHCNAVLTSVCISISILVCLFWLCTLRTFFQIVISFYIVWPFNSLWLIKCGYILSLTMTIIKLRLYFFI